MEVKIRTKSPRIVYFRLIGETSGYRYGLVLNEDTEKTIRDRLTRVFEREVIILEITN